jgi:DNA-binding MarR family transcriptional regulator
VERESVAIHTTRPAEVAALRDLAELIAAAARNPGVRERIGRAADAPITGASLVALRIIARTDPATTSHVARRLGLDLSTASRQIRPLEHAGLVARTPDPTDRRVALLSLTDAGSAVLTGIDDVICDAFAGALADWSEPDRAALAVLVRRLHTALVKGDA